MFNLGQISLVDCIVIMCVFIIGGNTALYDIIYTSNMRMLLV